MQIELPPGIHPNDLIAALTAGAEAVNRTAHPADPMASYHNRTLRDFRDAVVRESRK